MKLPRWTLVAAALTTASMWTAACGQDDSSPSADSGEQSSVDMGAVSPALAGYRDQIVEAELWQRPGLSARDRSVVTVASLIARNQTVDMREQFSTALDNGVTAGELSEIITHLAFYAGWPNAQAAVAAAEPVFADRGIDPADLPVAEPELLPLDQQAEAARRANVEQNYGGVSPGVEQYTTEVLFTDLWLRPDLAPRDRSLVTVSALVANGQVEQVPFHLGRAMDNGLTREQAGETLTQLAFYAGWPNVFSALPVFREVFAGREG
ncbi:carboxymuconolactone decarboxylase family protein [Mycolicibacterium sp. 3033]|nr:carboxymuconolactone decarboxylase family protein [Mycolicibacterium aurantiacum]